MQLTLFSPAKLNLFFRVLSKRPDGYHEIASVMQAVDLYDELTFQIQSVDSFETDVPIGPSNSIEKAISLFREKTGHPLHVHVKLKKRIPMEAGLGGGSSNAATTLWGLNQLAGGVATTNDLMRWSGEIGSDVPFFFSRGVAYCTGRGEKIESLGGNLLSKAVIAKPTSSLSTPRVYSLARPGAVSSDDPEEIKEKLIKGYPHFVNDLEFPSFQLLPELERLKKNLLEFGFETVMMTGSGTAFFCTGSLPKIPDVKGVDFFEVRGVIREKNEWYSPKETLINCCF